MMRSSISVSVLVLFGTLSFACGGADDAEEGERTSQESSAMKACPAMWSCSVGVLYGFCGAGTEHSCSWAYSVCAGEGGAFTMVNCHGAF
jgi:hypothetical protein